MDLEFLNDVLITIGNQDITLATLLGVLVSLLVAKFFIWLINSVVLSRYFKQKKLDRGRTLAIKQFVRYIVWVLATFSILEVLGITSMIWTAGAALLVGIGLGLQETFKDLISGIVILVEGSTEVGDIIEMDNTVANVQSIGLRTSQAVTREGISIIIPNSRLVIDKVVNWSHVHQPNRFSVKVGVAYGSNLSKVQELLLQAAHEHRDVLKAPPPRVQFKDFGNSSLDFELFFYSDEFFRIEFVKSEIRFAIDKLFRENDVTIPFPQRDLWIRNPENLG